MAQYSGQNLNQPGAYVPPPPTEVSIRTLDSDVRTMALSGGNFPQAEKVSVAHTTRYNAMGQPTNYEPKSSALVVIVWIFAIVIFLGALAYFIYPFIWGEKDEVPAPNGNPTNSSGLPEVPEENFVPEFSHRSFFTKGQKQVLETRVNYPDDLGLNTESYTRDFIRAIGSQAKPDETFLEIEINKTTGDHLALVEFFDWAKFSLADESFWRENFGPDFNYFIFKEKNNFWSGVVVRPKEGKSPILLRKDLLKIEGSKDLEKFFFTSPGVKEGNFSDFLLVGQSVRYLKFSRMASAFVYGWYNGNLIIATSEGAFKEAMARL